MDSPDNHQSNLRRPRLQFRLLELFIFMTISSISFALLRRWGMRGFMEQVVAAGFVGGFFACIAGIHFRIKHNLGL
jgi:hypothetical protein